MDLASAPAEEVEGVSVVECETSHTLVITARDRAGLLADLSQHCRASGVDIVSASVATEESSGLVVDSFVVHDAATGGKLAAKAVEALCSSLRQVACATPSPVSCRPSRTSIDLARNMTTVASSETPARRRSEAPAGEEDDLVTLSNEDNDRFTMLRVEVPDRPGLLTDLMQTLRIANVSVVAASIQTHGATAVDVFKVQDSETGRQLSADKIELLRRGVAHRARRQGISQSLGHSKMGGAEPLPSAAPSTPPSPADLLLIDQACRSLPPFTQLLTSERTQIYSEMRRVQSAPGALLLAEGAELQHFIVVASGSVLLAERALQAGAVLGELGIVTSALSPVAWRAGASGAVLYAVGRRHLHSLLHSAAGTRRSRAAALLSALPMLSGLASAQLYALTDVMARCELPAGAPLATAFLHVVITGSVALGDRGALHSRAEDVVGASGAACASPGDCFGEAACLASGASWAQLAGSCVALTQVELLCCDRATFARVLGEPESVLLPSSARMGALFRRVEAIAEDEDMDFELEVSDAPQKPPPAARPGSAAMPIPRAAPASAAADGGSLPSSMGVSAGSVGRRFRTASLDVGMQAAFAAPQRPAGLPCPAPARPPAVSALSAAVLRPGSLPSGAEVRGGAAAAPKGSWRLSLSLPDFLLGARLGEGLTGRVHYARLRLRGSECALKVMRKARLLELGEEHHVRSELEALERIRSPFVTALLGCFQDAHALYLALEYMRGPDLFAYMHEVNAPTGFERSVPPYAVRYYTAQVLLGLEALHCSGYVYRDLKPENILMDGRGNLKLADLGFAKLVFDGGRAYTVCGTPDYLAPEVIEHRGATRGSDYWALGVLIFEFIAGFPPFQGEPKWFQFKKICAGVIDYWPERFPADARDIVTALLQTAESHRLGLLAGGVSEIKAHPFYAALDWSALAALALPPPFRPSEAEWRQATASPADSKRLAAELEASMAHDRMLTVAQEAVFAGFKA